MRMKTTRSIEMKNQVTNPINLRDQEDPLKVITLEPQVSPTKVIIVTTAIEAIKVKTVKTIEE